MQMIAPMYDLSYVLKRYGFNLGKELVAEDARYADAFCNDCELDWWWKFAPDPDGGSPYLMGEDAHPLVSICVNPETRLLYCDVEVYGTYHTSGSDLDVITDTIAELAKHGFLWRDDRDKLR